MDSEEEVEWDFVQPLEPRYRMQSDKIDTIRQPHEARCKGRIQRDKIDAIRENDNDYMFRKDQTMSGIIMLILYYCGLILMGPYLVFSVFHTFSESVLRCSTVNSNIIGVVAAAITANYIIFLYARRALREEF